MASLQQEPTGVFHIVLRLGGKRYKRSLHTKVESKAISRRDEIQETVDLLRRGKIKIPEGTAAIDFVLHDEDAPVSSNQSDKPVVESPDKVPYSPTPLVSVFERFFDAIPSGNVEDETLRMMHIHKRHLLRILSPKLDFAKLTGEQLQSYVSKRAKEKTQYFIQQSGGKKSRRPVGASTIRKEITTLGAAWKWAKTVPLVTTEFPKQGLRFPKTDEKPPFQTWQEIERQIALGKLNACEADELWECLFLRTNEITDLLSHVKLEANYEYVYPMFAMAAYTGARRGELLRSRRADFDFELNFVTIRERKRLKGLRSSRRVPLTQELRSIMEFWFDHGHPGGAHTFCCRKANATLPISGSQAQSQFRHTLEDSRWRNIKGWHCLRHSFISNLACAGVDQRIIDDFVGHSTEEMRRRYRHLFPDVKQAAIDSVFGAKQS